MVRRRIGKPIVLPCLRWMIVRELTPSARAVPNATQRDDVFEAVSGARIWRGSAGRAISELEHGGGIGAGEIRSDAFVVHAVMSPARLSSRGARACALKRKASSRDGKRGQAENRTYQAMASTSVTCEAWDTRYRDPDAV